MDKYDKDWNAKFYYDETSPSCLRRREAVWAGNKDNPYSLISADEPVGSTSKGGYWTTYEYSGNYRNTGFLVHRIVWIVCKGRLSPRDFIDHINGNSLDNRIENLRVVSKAVNCRNAKIYSTNTSGAPGVYHDKKTFPSDGVDRYYFKSSWMELDGKQKTKSFSIDKLGVMVAFRNACQWREQQIARLNAEGAGYSERHGT